MRRPSLTVCRYQSFVFRLIRLPATATPSRGFRASCFPLHLTDRPLLRRAVSKVASQPPDGNEAPDLDSGICFHAIDDAEAFSRYGPGGYHPVVVGDRLDGRYRILNKLGHGSYSTVWLARDETLQRLVAVKVCTADARPRESEILHILNNFSEADGSNVSGPRMLPTLLSTFRVDGPNGTHTCLVTEVTRCSVVEAKRRSTSAPLMLPVARAIAAQLILAVDYLHQNGFVHGGERPYPGPLLRSHRDIRVA